ncbi:hypothetical protein [Tumebacillus flagellatus]|uniref:Uncharacterized protein n=1 Tax=Tumebacillus flagellatus TaxID=1157490 RepID=A0A074LIT9_9BACL|nr:hypothetical protein [Tumebacillus flagellatus]KEO81044.1 hypothetical protein EL26_22965 [Tumebacillus flagellatus]
MAANQIRLLLEQTRDDMVATGHKYTHLVTIVELPSGAREVIVNTDELQSKIEYLLKTYDEGMRMKANSAISIVGATVV